MNFKFNPTKPSAFLGHRSPDQRRANKEQDTHDTVNQPSLINTLDDSLPNSGVLVISAV